MINRRVGNLNASPWAVKKINSKCAAKQVTVYQERLNEEAKVLKGINHPNIVGKSGHCCDGDLSQLAVTQKKTDSLFSSLRSHHMSPYMCKSVTYIFH